MSGSVVRWSEDVSAPSLRPHSILHAHAPLPKVWLELDAFFRALAARSNDRLPKSATGPNPHTLTLTLTSHPHPHPHPHLNSPPTLNQILTQAGPDPHHPHPDSDETHIPLTQAGPDPQSAPAATRRWMARGLRAPQCEFRPTREGSPT